MSGWILILVGYGVCGTVGAILWLHRRAKRRRAASEWVDHLVAASDREAETTRLHWKQFSQPIPNDHGGMFGPMTTPNDPWEPSRNWLREQSIAFAKHQEERLLEEQRILSEEGPKALQAHLNLREVDRRAMRDRQREETERFYAEQAARHRAEHISTVAAALSQYPHFREEAIELAACAVDALLTDGVVFASMGPCEDPYP